MIIRAYKCVVFLPVQHSIKKTFNKTFSFIQINYGMEVGWMLVNVHFIHSLIILLNICIWQTFQFYRFDKLKAISQTIGNLYWLYVIMMVFVMIKLPYNRPEEKQDRISIFYLFSRSGVRAKRYSSKVFQGLRSSYEWWMVSEANGLWLKAK